MTGLTNGTAYTFTLKAVDASGNKSAGTTVVSTPADTTHPAKVTGLNGTPGDGQVSLSWTDPADGDLASIEITWTGGGNVSVAKGTQTKTITGLNNGTAYTFTVKAVDSSGNKSAGITSAAITPQVPPTGTVTIRFTGLPQEENITLTGADTALSWIAETSLTASVEGSFTAYRWFLDGVIQGEDGSTLTLSAGNMGIREHTLTVFVTKDGVEYAKRVIFTVAP
jgi:chitodextrinase